MVRKRAPFLLFMAVQALVVAVVILGIFHPGPNSGLRGSSIVHSLLGHVLALHYCRRRSSFFTRWRAWK